MLSKWLDTAWTKEMIQEYDQKHEDELVSICQRKMKEREQRRKEREQKSTLEDLQLHYRDYDFFQK